MSERKIGCRDGCETARSNRLFYSEPLRHVQPCENCHAADVEEINRLRGFLHEAQNYDSARCQHPESQCKGNEQTIARLRDELEKQGEINAKAAREIETLNELIEPARAWLATCQAIAARRGGIRRLTPEELDTMLDTAPRREDPREAALRAAEAAVEQYEVSIASLERVRDKQAKALAAADALADACDSAAPKLGGFMPVHVADALNAYRLARTPLTQKDEPTR